MVYVSSACLKHEKIKDSVEELACNGFKNIELSGGTKYYKGYEEDILKLKDKFKLNYLLHNYFPPPKKDFVLNLASLDDEIYQKSLAHYERAIEFSKRLDLDKFGLHAGFFIDLTVQEIGKKIALTKFFERGKATKRFCEGCHYLKKKANGIEIYIENNVLSDTNAKIFDGQNPFMLTDYSGYVELENFIDFKLLLDIGHLNVSANSLKLDFRDQLNKLIIHSDYIHLSDNNGLHDQGYCLGTHSSILDILEGCNFHGKIITLETRGDIADVKSSQRIIQRFINEKD